MQLTIERDLLAEALTKVIGAVQRKVTAPVLAHFLLVTGHDMLLIRGTDMDLEVTMPVPAEVLASGLGTVDARMLCDIVGKLPKGSQVSLTHEPGKSRLKVVCGRAKFHLASLEAADFPQIDQASVGEAHMFEMQAGELRALIDTVRFAISTDETRYYLNGVYLHDAARAGAPEALGAVATDGHTLALKTMALPAGASGLGVILPRLTCAELMKFLPEGGTAEVSIVVTPRIFKVTMGNAEMVSKLIDGTFPDFRRVIPDTAGLQPAIVPREALLAAVARVAVVLDDKSHMIGLRWSGDAVRVSGRGAERCSDALDVTQDVTWAGDAVTVGVNNRYFASILGAAAGAQVAVWPGDGKGPLRVEEVDGGGDLVLVLMPMKGAGALDFGDGAAAKREAA